MEKFSSNKLQKSIVPLGHPVDPETTYECEIIYANGREEQSVHNVRLRRAKEYNVQHNGQAQLMNA